MDVFITILAFILSIIIFGMKEVVIILKIGLTLLISMFFFNIHFPNIQIVNYSDWNWNIVLSTIKSSYFRTGSIYFIITYLMFYYIIPLLTNIFLTNKMESYIQSKIFLIDKRKKLRSLIYLRKFMKTMYKFKLVNPSNMIEEINFVDYKASVILWFNLILQFLFVAVFYKLSVLNLIISIFSVLLVGIALLISPIFLYISNFFFKLNQHEHSRNNKPIS